MGRESSFARAEPPRQLHAGSAKRLPASQHRTEYTKGSSTAAFVPHAVIKRMTAMATSRRCMRRSRPATKQGYGTRELPVDGSIRSGVKADGKPGPCIWSTREATLPSRGNHQGTINPGNPSSQLSAPQSNSLQKLASKNTLQTDELVFAKTTWRRANDADIRCEKTDLSQRRALEA